MALISSERSSKKSSSLRSRIAIKIFLCKLMKAAAAAAGGDGAAARTRVEATARAEGQMLDSMEHACQLQISTSPSPIAVVQKAVRIFNWKAQKSKKRMKPRMRQPMQTQLLPATGQQSGARTHTHTCAGKK